MALSHHSELSLTLKHTELLFPFSLHFIPRPLFPHEKLSGVDSGACCVHLLGYLYRRSNCGDVGDENVLCHSSANPRSRGYKGILPGNWAAKLVPGFCLWLGEGGHCVYIVLFLYAYKHVPLSKFPYWWGHQFDWIRTHPNDVILTSLPPARPCL